MPSFYKIHSPSFTHREYWWGNRSPLVLLAWLLKWLRTPLPGSSDDPNCESTLPFVVDALPPEVTAHFDPVTRELTALGFADPVFHLIHDPSTSTTIYWATFRHSSGQHVARIHQRLWHQAKKADRGRFVLFLTPFADGTFAVSSSGKPDIAAPPSVPMLRKPGAGTLDLWSAHQVFATQEGKAAQLIRSREELLDASERLHISQRDFHLARGVFRKRSAEEQADADALASHVSQLHGAGVEHAGVLAELERLQTQKPSWGNALLILVISIAAFFAAGSAQFDWKFTLWLIPILLVHEAGHWVAMRIFGYRNVRMFFIPFFGAAVTGRNWNVPGWKKALVSLAGPVPGIFIGAGLAVGALISHNENLNKAALLLLFLNGFNLLPVLPLDGGHVLHVTLFCRNRWLDFAFRVVAVVALALLSLMAGGKVLLYIAIALGVGLPMAFKLGKVIEKLRSAPPPLFTPTNDDRIPTPMAQSIIAALKAELPAVASNKVVAQHTINVYETLNAHPPGIFATFALLGLHGFSFFLVLVFGIALLVAQHGGFGMLGAGFAQPKHLMACNGVQRAGSGAASDAPTHIIAVTAQKRPDAERAFQRFSPRVPDGGRLSLIGNSLLMTFPATNNAARETWFNEFSAVASNAFVTLSNRSLSVSFTCIAPDDGTVTNITRELTDYLNAAYMGDLVPPWSPEATKPSYAAAQSARRDWNRLNGSMNGVWTNADTLALSKQALQATRRGDPAEADRLRKAQAALARETQTNLYAKLGKEGIDADLIQLHQQLAALSYTNRANRAALQRRVAERLGGAGGITGNSPDAASYGAVSHTGLVLRMNWISFKDGTVGWPAFTDWLCARGCRDVRYTLHSSTSYVDEDDER
jgi:Zn-dependent protease